MFTGIVTDVGRVRSVRDTNRDRRFEIETGFDTATIDLGASVSHAGCCLTVVDKGRAGSPWRSPARPCR
jgi:riboflavin synthase